MKIAITGHQPKRYEGIKGQEKRIREWIITQLINLRGAYDDITLVSGMAKGVDQIAAEAAISLGVGVECFYAFREGRKFLANEVYIMNRAAGVRFNEEKFQDGGFLRRDRRMIDECDVLLVVWDGVCVGGTYEAYCYAKEQGKNMLIFPWKLD